MDVEAFGIPAEGVGGGRRGERDDPEDVVPFMVAAQGREQGETVQKGTERRSGIATEETLGMTTGDGGAGGPPLGQAFTWPLVPATRPPSMVREGTITIGTVIIMLRRVPVMLSSRLHQVLSFMPFHPRQPWCMRGCMRGQDLTIITAEHTI